MKKNVSTALSAIADAALTGSHQVLESVRKLEEVREEKILLLSRLFGIPPQDAGKILLSSEPFVLYRQYVEAQSGKPFPHNDKLEKIALSLVKEINRLSEAVPALRSDAEEMLATAADLKQAIGVQEPSKNPVYMFTDGACKGNPGRGGWGVYLVGSFGETELSGGEKETTNNRMEMTAVIEGLRRLPDNQPVVICTDSQYVKNGMESWIHGWKKNGWRTSNGTPVKNEDLWRELDELVSRRNVSWTWVKGHAGHPGNERADRLASTAAENQ